MTPAAITAMDRKPRTMGSHQSARAISTIWLTPPEIIRALGHFDLDPCACPEPEPWITASEHWTVRDRSLLREWRGRVWLNPPFGPKDLVLMFMRRMVDHNHGIALLFARTGDRSVSCQTVWGKASAVLFLKGRPHFHRQDGTRAKANSGAPVVLIAYGRQRCGTGCGRA